jgi:hypothetical protein
MDHPQPQDGSYSAYCRERAAECRRRADRAVVRDVAPGDEAWGGKGLGQAAMKKQTGATLEAPFDDLSKK